MLLFFATIPVLCLESVAVKEGKYRAGPGFWKSNVDDWFRQQECFRGHVFGHQGWMPRSTFFVLPWLVIVTVVHEASETGENRSHTLVCSFELLLLSQFSVRKPSVAGSACFCVHGLQLLEWRLIFVQGHLRIPDLVGQFDAEVNQNNITDCAQTKNPRQAIVGGLLFASFLLL